MNQLMSFYLDENKVPHFMSQNDVIRKTAEALMMDYYNRKAEEGGIFFGLDTGRYCTKLEDLREDKYWKNNFDIDFRIAFGGKLLLHER